MQRVAIGRALVRRPKALLMDEPIGSLDAKLREQMRAEIKRLHISRGSTSVYVTHDQVEAMSLADRMVVMHKGIMQQVGAPDEVYLHPANLYVAQFVGSPVMNVVDVTVEGGGTEAVLRVGGQAGFRVPSAVVAHLGGAPVKLGVRPEAILLSHEPREGYTETQTTNVEPLGSHDIVDLQAGTETLRARCASGFVHGEGAKVWMAVDPHRVHFFDAASGNSLRGAV
jgi:multiple sugar transport system ATP-binding protein